MVARDMGTIENRPYIAWLLCAHHNDYLGRIVAKALRKSGVVPPLAIPPATGVADRPQVLDGLEVWNWNWIQNQLIPKSDWAIVFFEINLWQLEFRINFVKLFPK